MECRCLCCYGREKWHFFHISSNRILIFQNLECVWYIGLHRCKYVRRPIDCLEILFPEWPSFIMCRLNMFAINFLQTQCSFFNGHPTILYMCKHLTCQISLLHDIKIRIVTCVTVDWQNIESHYNMMVRAITCNGQQNCLSITYKNLNSRVLITALVG